MPDQMPDTDRRRIPVDVLIVYHRGDRMARIFEEKVLFLNTSATISMTEILSSDRSDALINR